MGQQTTVWTTFSMDEWHLNKVFVVLKVAIKEGPNKLSISIEMNVYSLCKAIS